MVLLLGCGGLMSGQIPDPIPETFSKPSGKAISYRKVIVNKNFGKIFEDPDSESKVIELVKKNDVLLVLNEKKHSLRVRTINGKVGWIVKSVIQDYSMPWYLGFVLDYYLYIIVVAGVTFVGVLGYLVFAWIKHHGLDKKKYKDGLILEPKNILMIAKEAYSVKSFVDGKMNPLDSTLNELGYKTRQVKNLRIAMDLISHIQKPDLILMDNQVYNHEDGEVVRDFNIDSKTCNIPIILYNTQNDAFKKIGRIVYMPKYFSDRDLVDIVIKQMQSFYDGSLEKKSISGSLAYTHLSDLLQFFEISRKTGRLNILDGRRQGYVYIKDGQVVDAVFRRQKGVEGLYQMMSLPSGIFEMELGREAEEKTIHDSTTNLILNWAVEADLKKYSY